MEGRDLGGRLEDGDMGGRGERECFSHTVSLELVFQG